MILSQKTDNSIKKKFKAYIFIILVNFEFFIAITITVRYTSYIVITPKLIGKILNQVKLFFGIVTAEGSWFRRQVMKEIWLDNILKQGHDYVYCTKTQIEPQYHWIPLKDWINLTKNGKNYTADVDRMQKRITMAEYFLKNTSADFFINPTDDVFVDSARINQFASALGRKYNTNEDMVMLGHCIFHCFHGGTFLQGGAGYLMTRKMAQKFVFYAEKWINESSTADDVEITRFLSYVNQTPKDCASNNFAGFGFHALKKKNYDFNMIPYCPKFYEPLCGTGILKVEDVYILHPDLPLMKPSLRTWENFQRMLKDKEHSYGWYSNHNCRTKLCKIN